MSVPARHCGAGLGLRWRSYKDETLKCRQRMTNSTGPFGARTGEPEYSQNNGVSRRDHWHNRSKSSVFRERGYRCRRCAQRIELGPKKWAATPLVEGRAVDLETYEITNGTLQINLVQHLLAP
jgi:hypothetical protein